MNPASGGERPQALDQSMNARSVLPLGVLEKSDWRVLLLTHAASLSVFFDHCVQDSHFMQSGF